jgi:hypothetical protein
MPDQPAARDPSRRGGNGLPAAGVEPALGRSQERRAARRALEAEVGMQTQAPLLLASGKADEEG